MLLLKRVLAAVFEVAAACVQLQEDRQTDAGGQGVQIRIPPCMLPMLLFGTANAVGV